MVQLLQNLDLATDSLDILLIFDLRFLKYLDGHLYKEKWIMVKKINSNFSNLSLSVLLH